MQAKEPLLYRFDRVLYTLKALCSKIFFEIWPRARLCV